MTEHERRSIARHRHQAQTYRDLASDHELMAEAPAEEWEHAPPFLQEIPKGHAPAWYQEQAAHYRAQAAHENALAALEYEVAQKAWLAQFSPEQQADIREMHAKSLKHTIAVLERQIAELHAELQFWQPA